MQTVSSAKTIFAWGFVMCILGVLGCVFLPATFETDIGQNLTGQNMVGQNMMVQNLNGQNLRRAKSKEQNLSDKRIGGL